MGRKATKYQRVCDKCDEIFISETRYRRICDRCKGLFMTKEEKMETITKTQVHEIIADWYDEELERNEVNAKINYSRATGILKERIDNL